ncbi:hypothetical protein [Spongiactinospora rosea]|uniref:hypothetical protein n=1 Tax=Spongiactinospora rosea TaxID=2248750 RepID=UPI0011C0251D|nr:hypothetical protein [Spongiactinospora rosea]
MTPVSPESVRLAVEAVLDGLGLPVPWTIFDIDWTPGSPLPMTVTVGPRPREAVVAYCDPHGPWPETVVRLASDLQDHACEVHWGRPFPPCPGHTHPLATGVAGGVAVWECPVSPRHHRSPILPDGTP